MTQRLATEAAPQAPLIRTNASRWRSSIIEQEQFLLEFWEKSSSFREPYVKVWDEVTAHYTVAPLWGGSRGSVRGFTTPIHNRGVGMGAGGYSILKDPETNSIVDQNTAQGLRLLMPDMDFIHATPIGSDDPEKARYLSRLLARYLKSPGVYGTQYLNLKDSFLYGVSVVKIGWETRSRLQMTRKPVFKGGLMVGEEPDIADVVYRDCPLMEGLDIYDCFWDPGGTRIQEDMMGFGWRFHTSKNEVIRMASGDNPTYSPQLVREMLARISSRAIDSGDDDDRFRALGENERPVAYDIGMGFEWWGEYPGTLPPDGARNRAMTMIEGCMTRTSINPFEDGNIPVKEIVLNPVKGRFPGLGPAETRRYLQDSLDGLLMMHQDAMDLAVRNILLVGKNNEVHVDRLRQRSPNDVLTMRDVNQIKPLEVNSQAVAIGQSEIARRKQSMREGAVPDSAAMIADIDRPVATSVNAITRQAAAGIELQVELIENDSYPWIGKTLHSRLRQFLSREREAILAGELMPVELADIDYDADIEFVGTRKTQSKVQLNMMHRETLNAVSMNPKAIIYAPEQFAEFLRDVWDVKDAEARVQMWRERLLENPELLMDPNTQASQPSGEMETDESITKRQGQPVE